MFFHQILGMINSFPKNFWGRLILKFAFYSPVANPKKVELFGHSSTDVPCYSKKTEEDPQDENVAVVSKKIEEIKKESERKGESECNTYQN